MSENIIILATLHTLNNYIPFNMFLAYSVTTNLILEVAIPMQFSIIHIWFIDSSKRFLHCLTCLLFPFHNVHSIFKQIHLRTYVISYFHYNNRNILHDIFFEIILFFPVRVYWFSIFKNIVNQTMNNNNSICR